LKNVEEKRSREREKERGEGGKEGERERGERKKKLSLNMGANISQLEEMVSTSNCKRTYNSKHLNLLSPSLLSLSLTFSVFFLTFV
jgi:hypothetical protein